MRVLLFLLMPMLAQASLGDIIHDTFKKSINLKISATESDILRKLIAVPPLKLKSAGITEDALTKGIKQLNDANIPYETELDLTELYHQEFKSKEDSKNLAITLANFHYMLKYGYQEGRANKCDVYSILKLIIDCPNGHTSLDEIKHFIADCESSLTLIFNKRTNLERLIPIYFNNFVCKMKLLPYVMQGWEGTTTALTQPERDVIKAFRALNGDTITKLMDYITGLEQLQPLLRRENMIFDQSYHLRAIAANHFNWPQQEVPAFYLALAKLACLAKKMAQQKDGIDFSLNEIFDLGIDMIKPTSKMKQCLNNLYENILTIFYSVPQEAVNKNGHAPLIMKLLLRLKMFPKNDAVYYKNMYARKNTFKRLKNIMTLENATLDQKRRVHDLYNRYVPEGLYAALGKDYKIEDPAFNAAFALFVGFDYLNNRGEDFITCWVRDTLAYRMAYDSGIGDKYLPNEDVRIRNNVGHSLIAIGELDSICKGAKLDFYFYKIF